MNRSQKLVLAAGLVMVAVLVARPPYFGMDRASGGRTHAAIGLHWLWDPPASAEVYARLTQRDPAAVAPARLADFAARVNVVRLAMKLVAVALVVAMGMALTRTRAGAIRAGGPG
jgi:hypothetical protein